MHQPPGRRRYGSACICFWRSSLSLVSLVSSVTLTSLCVRTQGPGTLVFFPLTYPRHLGVRGDKKSPRRKTGTQGRKPRAPQAPGAAFASWGSRDAPSPPPAAPLRSPPLLGCPGRSPGSPRDRSRGRGVSQELSCGSAGGGGTDQGPAPQEAPRRRPQGGSRGSQGPHRGVSGDSASRDPGVPKPQPNAQRRRGPGRGVGVGSAGTREPRDDGEGVGLRAPLPALQPRGQRRAGIRGLERPSRGLSAGGGARRVPRGPGACPARPSPGTPRASLSSTQPRSQAAAASCRPAPG